MTRVLERRDIPYLVLELNAETVRRAREENVPIVYGDAIRREVLLHAGLQRAAILVLAISDQLATRHVVALARELQPDLHIIVRTRYLSEVSELYELGATQVIPEEFETSIEIFARVLERYGLAPAIIQQEAEAVRRACYEVLRSVTMENDYTPLEASNSSQS